MVVADKLTGGGNGYAGEIGHVQVPGALTPCQCGKNGCLETVASVPAVLAAAGVASVDALQQALKDRDPVARQVLEDMCEAVTLVCVPVVLALNPDLVVLGGELVRAVPEIVGLVASRTQQEIPPVLRSGVAVAAARLGDDGGARGAIAAVGSYRAARRATQILAKDML